MAVRNGIVWKASFRNEKLYDIVKQFVIEDLKLHIQKHCHHYFKHRMIYTVVNFAVPTALYASSFIIRNFGLLIFWLTN